MTRKIKPCTLKIGYPNGNIIELNLKDSPIFIDGWMDGGGDIGREKDGF